MIKYTLIVVIFCSVAQAFAQTPAYEWAKNMGGTSSTRGNSIATDVSGNVYTTGIFSGTTDFDPGAGTYNLTALGDQDAFITKSDPNGNLVWAFRIGGASSEFSYGIAVDAGGNVYTTGSYALTVDFNPGAGTFDMTAKGGSDVYILKLNTSGNFVWARSVGGVSIDDSYGITLDASGNIYCTGDFVGEADFDPGAGTLNLVSKGDLDIFVLKLDANGNLIWAKNMGGVGADAGYSVAVDATGNVYSTGLFTTNADFDPGAFDYEIINLGISDIYVSKLDVSGNFVWAKQMGGPRDEYGVSLVLDKSANVYTTGWFYGTTDFDPGPATYNLTSALGGSNIFISKLNTAGNFVWAKSIGGSDYTYAQGYAIAIDSGNNSYITGIFTGITDFDPGANVYNLTSAGYSDAFLLKADPSGNMVWAGALSGKSVEKGNSVTTDASGNIYCAGEFSGTVDFDPGAGVAETTAIQSDAFVVKLGQSPTGISDNTRSAGISVYPNPAGNSIIVGIPELKGNASLAIYNGFGSLVYKQNTVKTHNSIDLTGQPAGLYYVNVISNGKISATRKIVKE